MIHQRKTTVTITDQHLKLLMRAVVGWSDTEYGAPCIDPKRPYGNSDVASDIASILGIDAGHCPTCFQELDELPEEVSDKLYDLHEETYDVLQVCLARGAFESGTFVYDSSKRVWSKK